MIDTWKRYQMKGNIDINEKNDRYRIAEMIMVKPFDNLLLSIPGTVRKICLYEHRMVYLVFIGIDQGDICCL